MEEHERLHTPQAHEKRDIEIRRILRLQGVVVITQQFAEMLHDANAIIAQADRYPDDMVDAQRGYRLQIYTIGRGYKLDSLEVDHLCEDEYARRQEQQRADERDTELGL